MARNYHPDDDLVHNADGDPAFQDSHWLMWYDTDHGIGGFHRLGVNPARESAAFMCGVVTRAGDRFRALDWSVPWAASTGRGYVVSDAQRLILDDGLWQLKVRDRECDADLIWHGWGPMLFYGAQATTSTAHYEGAGTVTGTVRLGSDRYEVNALAFRDRSWGPRDYLAVLAHRWFAGTFGADLSFSAMTILLPDGHLHRDGIVIRDGRVHCARDVDIVIRQEADGFSNRGGTLRLGFADAEDFVVEAAAIDGIAFGLPGGLGYTVETMCVANAEGRQGFCNVEATNNIHRAIASDSSVPLSIGAAVDDGLTRRAT
ncbi:hypothetical protein ORI20_16765 [Mycobacterium sp. CVI_P3]|uniref:AttH domain-containing protein n=1 Tax=Mycobacterium pinniadriaticum TaxID=2994102 RepID=A0ABT3SFG8_9MYCO|nr:hypothetical protein [Mycobacterium pinniadriaticum]MCX2931937.1 hypothetical protein [Mycobacterium pinniadriaticum]MCX2938252.1 hypothetical protein [Mycobacterium pinniadriaticum]